MKNNKTRSRLWLYFTLIIFVTIIVIFLIILILWVILYRNQIIAFPPAATGFFPILLLIASGIIGAIVSIFVGRLIIRPIQHIRDAFGQLAEGDFSVRVPTDQLLSEIREMAERFNAMAYDLSQIETLRSDFVANVSHEFKTPIAAIEGYATLLQGENLNPEKRSLYIEKIISNSRKLSVLTSNILTLSKLENQESVPDMESYRLDEQIRRNILLLENQWSEKNIEFDLTLPSVTFFGSEALLDEVWFNLLDNAIKHSPEGGTIQLVLSASGSGVKVRIADHGEGMSEEIQKHIFEKFYQGDTSHISEGNGLGLALVKSIVDLCHGEIHVKSAPGEGAEFTVLLPL
ncbi:MAG: HAMP domain-containing histidine kinase [Lachnospiraceae bacterium]|nr:HAMP domain-containing histidine kinase [Lachnospiraceae bacterium]